MSPEFCSAVRNTPSVGNPEHHDHDGDTLMQAPVLPNYVKNADRNFILVIVLNEIVASELELSLFRRVGDTNEYIIRADSQEDGGFRVLTRPRINFGIFPRLLELNQKCGRFVKEFESTC